MKPHSIVWGCIFGNRHQNLRPYRTVVRCTWQKGCNRICDSWLCKFCRFILLLSIFTKKTLCLFFAGSFIPFSTIGSLCIGCKNRRQQRKTSWRFKEVSILANTGEWVRNWGQHKGVSSFFVFFSRVKRLQMGLKAFLLRFLPFRVPTHLTVKDSGLQGVLCLFSTQYKQVSNSK